jgi:hypothetical protein
MSMQLVVLPPPPLSPLQLSEFISVMNLIKHDTSGPYVIVRHHFILFTVHAFAEGPQESIPRNGFLVRIQSVVEEGGPRGT